MKKILFVFFSLLPFVSFSKKVEKYIEIPNGFYKIPAIYTYDDEKKNEPLVIMLHGSGSNKNEVGDTYVKLANALYSKGITSIRFDFIGTGDSKVDYMQYTPTTALNDVNKVIEYAREQTKGKLGLLGWSEGGTIALYAARNKELSSVATWAAATDLVSEVKDLYPEAVKNGYALHKFEWRTPLRQSLEWFREAKNLDVLTAVKEIQIPIMALAGTKDEDVNPKIASEIVKISSNKKSKVVMIKDSNHIFNIFTNNVKVNEGIKVTKDWFVDTLK